MKLTDPLPVTISGLSELPQNIRLAEYVKYYSELVAILARLRLDGRKDSEWTDEEELAWERQADAMDSWWYALTEDEREFVKPIIEKLSPIANGEKIGCLTGKNMHVIVKSN